MTVAEERTLRRRDTKVVDRFIQKRSEALDRRRGEIVLRTEAQKIVEDLRDEFPQELLDWAERYLVGLVRERLEIRLARRRAAQRESVFAGWADGAPKPFETRYALEDNGWKQTGDMLRGDWKYIAETRTASARVSLFELALARSMVERLPDDKTPTRDVLTEEEFVRVQKAAGESTEKVLQRHK